MPEQTTPDRTTAQESAPQSAPEPTAAEQSGPEPAAADPGADRTAAAPDSPAVDPATAGADSTSDGAGVADASPSQPDTEAGVSADAVASDRLVDGTSSGEADAAGVGPEVAASSEADTDDAGSTKADLSVDVAPSSDAGNEPGDVGDPSGAESSAAATTSDPGGGGTASGAEPIASADVDESGDESGDESDGESDGESDDDSPSGESLLVREGDFAGDYLERLLDILDLDGDIDLDVEGGRAVVDIVGGDLDSLVGPKGATLDALQELTRLTVAQETGVRTRLMLDIGGFRAGRRTELGDLATRTASKVLETGDTARLSPMNAFERKIVHDVVTATDGLHSESEGEDPQRRVVILREQ